MNMTLSCLALSTLLMLLSCASPDQAEQKSLPHFEYAGQSSIITDKSILEDNCLIFLADNNIEYLDSFLSRHLPSEIKVYIITASDSTIMNHSTIADINIYRKFKSFLGYANFAGIFEGRIAFTHNYYAIDDKSLTSLMTYYLPPPNLDKLYDSIGNITDLSFNYGILISDHKQSCDGITIIPYIYESYIRDNTVLIFINKAEYDAFQLSGLSEKIRSVFLQEFDSRSIYGNKLIIASNDGRHAITPITNLCNLISIVEESN